MTLSLIPKHFILNSGVFESYLSEIETWLEGESAQLPLYIPIFVALGISCWFTMEPKILTYILILLLFIILCTLFSKLRSRLSVVLCMASLSIIIGWSAISIRSYSVSSPIISKPWVGNIYGRIEKIEKLSARDVVRLTIETDERQLLPARVRINLSEEQYNKNFTHGSIIKMRVRLLPPTGPAVPGAYDFAQRAWFDKLGATGSALGNVALITQAKNNDNLDEIRNQLAVLVREKIPDRAGSIAATLATGDRGAIAMEDAEAMRRSGMAHLLAISGLHVTAIVAMSFYIIAKILSLFPSFALRQKVPLYAASFAALLAISYTLLTGAQVPTVRACIAACLVLAALMLGREAFTLRLVAFGALFILLMWPETLVGPSFQLSFAAVATIITLHESKWMQKLTHRREEFWFQAMGRFMISLFITGLVIEITLAPIALYHFQKTGVYGAWANMIAIPLTTFIIIPSLGVALLLDLIGLAAPFWWICGQSIEIILKLAHYVSNLPGAIKTTANVDSGIFAVVIISGLLLMLIKSKLRWAALAPLVVALTLLVRTPNPDILVTGDGRHLAVRNFTDKNIDKTSNEMLLLRTGAGEYIRELLNENAGFDGLASDIADWPNAQCSPDICIINLEYEDQNMWSILATKSSYFVPSLELAAACKRVDIAISDRYLPYSCKPKRLKIDRAFLEKSGGVSLFLDSEKIRNVASEQKHLPWSQYYENRITTYPAPWKDE